jgi:hypothetical protein
MEILIRDFGRMGRKTGRVFTRNLAALNTMENGYTIKKVDMEPISIQMVTDTRVNGNMTYKVDKVLSLFSLL